jgi:alpha-tubulin suppressor-like RCC1 family protein
LLNTGNLTCWGDNAVGQLGIGDTLTRGNFPNQLGDAMPLLMLGNGRKVISFSSADGHRCAALDNGDLKCWGYNSNGQLGLGEASPRGTGPNQMGDALPRVDLGLDRVARSVSVRRGATCALLDNGMVKCWGVNNYGQLGLGDTNGKGGQGGGGERAGFG